MDLAIATAVAQRGLRVVYLVKTVEREQELVAELRKQFCTIEKDDRTVQTFGGGRLTVACPGLMDPTWKVDVMVVEDDALLPGFLPKDTLHDLRLLVPRRH